LELKKAQVSQNASGESNGMESKMLIEKLFIEKDFYIKYEEINSAEKYACELYSSNGRQNITAYTGGAKVSEVIIDNDNCFLVNREKRVYVEASKDKAASQNKDNLGFVFKPSAEILSGTVSYEGKDYYSENYVESKMVFCFDSNEKLCYILCESHVMPRY